uniref:Uncharacterized protein n=1 Tax=Macaca fascicularis TaxID=9541 RepID=A0A7N9CU17_MACFA
MPLQKSLYLITWVKIVLLKFCPGRPIQILRNSCWTWMKLEAIILSEVTQKFPPMISNFSLSPLIHL